MRAVDVDRLVPRKRRRRVSRPLPADTAIDISAAPSTNAGDTFIASAIIQDSAPADIPALQDTSVQELLNDASSTEVILQSNLVDLGPTFGSIDPNIMLPVDDGNKFDLTEWLFGDEFGSSSSRQHLTVATGWSIGDVTTVQPSEPLPPRLLHAPGIAEFYDDNQASTSGAAPVREYTQSMPSELQLFAVWPQPWGQSYYHDLASKWADLPWGADSTVDFVLTEEMRNAMRDLFEVNPEHVHLADPSEGI